MQKYFVAEKDSVPDVRLALGEGPIWNPNRNAYYCVDIVRGSVYEIKNSRAVLRLELEMVSSINFNDKDEPIVTAGHKVFRFDSSFCGYKVIAEVEQDITLNRFNEAKVGPDGFLWAGTMDMSGLRNSGKLYKIDIQGNIQTLITDVGISNTLLWMEDQKRFLFADSRRGEIRSFDVNASHQQFASGSLFSKLPAVKGVPDGSCKSQANKIYSSRWGGGEITVLDADGLLSGCISVPTKNVTSCCFGGESLNELLITTAAVDDDGNSIQHDYLAGRVFIIKVGEQGTNSFRMKT